MPPLLYDSGSWRSTLEVKAFSLNSSPTIWQWLMKVNTGSEITVLECLPYYMTGTHEGQHWKWNYSPWMPPLLYDSVAWRSTLEVKSLSLNTSPTIWQRLTKVNTGSEITVFESPHYYLTGLMKFNIGSEITVLECPTIWQRLTKVNTGSEIIFLESLPYYMTVSHEGQHWKWNHCPWIPPLLYDIVSWRSTLEVKSLSLNSSPTIWQLLMKVTTGSKIILLEFIPYYMTEAHEGQHWNWNYCRWMPPLLYDRGSCRSTLEVKSLFLNASPTIWQGLMKVNTGSEITVLECLPYYMTDAHEGQHWKWNNSPWMPPLLYERGSWRSKQEVKSLSLNTSPTIWQRLMKVNTGSEITVLEYLPYYMTGAQLGQHWKWNHCLWMPPLLYERCSWRSTLEVKSLSLNFSTTIWQRLVKVNTGSEITVL